MLSATGPDAGTTTYTYHATTGNLLSMTNPLGHATSFANHDAHGRSGRIVDAKGETTDLTYSPRGWLLSQTVSGLGVSAVTTYSYDDAGQLAGVSLLEGAALSFQHDAAHRLTGIADSQGNRIDYTLDALGNRTDEQHRDPSGALARRITSTFDALGRL